MLPHASTVLSRIARDLPGIAVSTSPDELSVYGRDYTRVYDPAPSAVCFPRTTEEASAILAICHEHSFPVVPSGGRTGLAGGAMATRGELVLSLERMRSIGPVDTLSGIVHVQAGAVTEAVHAATLPHGLTWPVDFASKGSSHVGGNIATNAGGVKVIRYGLTRQWVLGLVVVLADGTILRLNGELEKNNTGTDLRQLFIGTEGTLGVVTEATLKLARIPTKLDVMLFGSESLESVLELFRHARQGPFALSAFEFFSHACFRRLSSHRKLRAPLADEYPYYVLVEAEAASDLEPWIGEVFERGLSRDGVMAQHEAEARELWQLREGISESLSATGLPHKNDIALPVSQLSAFCAELTLVFAEQYPGFEICLFGHIGDGNLHVNIMKPDDMDKRAFLEKAKAADRTMFELVRRHHGSVSAEHGIGLLKKAALGYSRSKEELSLFRKMKAVFDPRGILNPGKIFDGEETPPAG